MKIIFLLLLILTNFTYAYQKLLIITPNNTKDLYKEYIELKFSQGIKTYLKDFSEINDNYAGKDFQTRIKNCLIEYKKLENIEYVILSGDHSLIPVVKVWATTEMNKTPSDLYYFCLSKTDSNNNDIHFEPSDNYSNNIDLYGSRLPISNKDELKIFLQKINDYTNATKYDSTYFRKSFLFGFDLFAVNDTKPNILEAEQKLSNFNNKVKTQEYESFFKKDSILTTLNRGQNIFFSLSHGSELNIGNSLLRIYQNQIFQTSKISGLYLISSCHSGTIVSNSFAKSCLTSPKGGTINYIGSSFQEYVSSAKNIHNEVLNNVNNGKRIGVALNLAKESYNNILYINDLRRYSYFAYNLLGDPTTLIYQDNENLDFESINYSNNTLNLILNRIPASALNIIVRNKENKLLAQTQITTKEFSITNLPVDDSLKISFYSLTQPVKQYGYNPTNITTSVFFSHLQPIYSNNSNYTENNNKFIIQAKIVNKLQTDSIFRLKIYDNNLLIKDSLLYLHSNNNLVSLELSCPITFYPESNSEIVKNNLFLDLVDNNNNLITEDSLIINSKKASPKIVEALVNNQKTLYLSLANYSNYIFQKDWKLKILDNSLMLKDSFNLEKSLVLNSTIKYILNNNYQSNNTYLLQLYYKNQLFSTLDFKTTFSSIYLPKINIVKKEYTTNSAYLKWDINNLTADQVLFYNIFYQNEDNEIQLNNTPITQNNYQIPFSKLQKNKNNSYQIKITGYLQSTNRNKEYEEIKTITTIKNLDNKIIIAPVGFADFSQNALECNQYLVYQQRNGSIILTDKESSHPITINNTNYSCDYQMRLAIGDLDNDNKEEIIALNPLREVPDSFAVEIFSLDTKELICQKVIYGFIIKNIPVITNLDDDNNKEILICAINGNISGTPKGGYIYGLKFNNNKLSILPEYPIIQTANSYSIQAIDYIPLENNGTKYLCGDNGSNIYAYNLLTHNNFTYNVDGKITAPVTYADLNGDGNIECIIKINNSNGEYIKILTFDNNEFTPYSNFNSGLPLKFSTSLFDFYDIIAPVKVVDLDNNNSAEIIITSSDSLFVYSTNGNIKNNFPVEISTDNSHLNNSALSFSDLDNDNILDIIGINNQEQIFAISGDNGKNISGFPFSIPDLDRKTLLPPLIQNLILENKKSISVVNNNGSIYKLFIPYNGQNWLVKSNYREDNKNLGLNNLTFNNTPPIITNFTPSRNIIEVSSNNTEVKFSVTTIDKDQDLLCKKWFINNNEITTFSNDSLIINSENYWQNDSIKVSFQVADKYEIKNKEWLILKTVAINEDINKKEFKLHNLYPNPFNNCLNIKYTVGNETNITIKVINSNGQIVKSQSLNALKNKSNLAKISFTGLGSGIYYFMITSGNKKIVSKKVVYLK